MIDFDLMEFKQNLGNPLTRRVSVQHWFPDNPSELQYNVRGPDGAMVPWRNNSYFEINQTGTYYVRVVDPTGVLCPLEKTFYAEIRRPDNVSLSVTPFCASDAFARISLEQEAHGLTIRWFVIANGQQNPIPEFDNLSEIEVTEEGDFSITLADLTGCTIGTGMIQVRRSRQAQPNLDRLYKVCPTQQVKLAIEAGGDFSSAIWYLEGAEVSRSLVYHPELPGMYSIVATDFQGCETVADFEVELKCEPSLRYPSAVIPNVPEKAFVVYPDNLMASVEIFIRNRWGELIYYCEDRNPKSGLMSACVWDGTLEGRAVPNGSYVLMIRYQLKENNAYKIETGVINVLD